MDLTIMEEPQQQSSEVTKKASSPTNKQQQRLWNIVLPSFHSKKQDKRERIVLLLSTLTIVEQDGTLCALVNDQLLGTVEDSEFIRLSWYTKDKQGEIRRLKSLSPGFYQPTALDLNKTIICEGRVTFTKKAVVRAEFGPIQVKDDIKRAVASILTHETPSIGGLRCDTHGDVSVQLDVENKELKVVKDCGNDDILFSFHPEVKASLRVVLDASDPVLVKLVMPDQEMEIRAKERTLLALSLMALEHESITFLSSLEHDEDASTEDEEEEEDEVMEELERLRQQNAGLIEQVNSLRRSLPDSEGCEKVHRLSLEVESLKIGQEELSGENLELRKECDHLRGTISRVQGSSHKREEQIQKLEVNAQRLEAECFHLQSVLKTQEDLRIQSECRAKKVETEYETMVTSFNELKQKTDGLARDMYRLLQAASVETVNEVEERIRENGKLKKLLASREAEKMDLMQENLALRNALDKAESTKLQPAKGMFRKGKDSAALTAQHSQLRLLANSLMESVNEKDELIKQQRFANKVLAEKIQQLEKEATRWRR